MSELVSVAFGLAAALVNAVTLLVLLRIYRQVGPINMHAMCDMGMHIVTVVVGIVFVDGFYYWHAAAVYWFVCMIFLYVYSAFYKAISLKILRGLVRRNGVPMPVRDAYADFVFPSFSQRTGLLVESNLVELEEGRYRLTQKGSVTATKIRRMQTLYGVDSFGLYFVR